MAAAALPQDPDLDQLRRQARELQRAVRAGDESARQRARRWQPEADADFPLTTAQLVLAREHGFSSWARLRHYVRIVTARSWTPGRPPATDESPADRFLRSACLTYSGDDAAGLAAARRMLAEQRQLPRESLLVAAACADVPAVRRHLAAQSAATIGGPHGWSPLLYQAYARHDPRVGRTATLETARLLLAAGADPNDGRFWHALPTPFTVLTGVLGGGEGDQSRHPHSIAFARLLLEAGADPNDGQALYNRMFDPDDDHLMLLFEFGLGTDTRGPWQQLLGAAMDSPAVMLRGLLLWAITHGQRDRVALLAAHGVDVVSRCTELGNRYTPIENALLSGNPKVADVLRELGAGAPHLAPADAVVAAALAGDADTVRAASARTVAAARRKRPGLPTWAARHGAPNAVELLVSAGFDVNAYGRSDIPSNQRWETPLHVAAGDGNLPLAQRLLALGADPRLRDERFDGTPLDWANHFGRPELIELLSRGEDPAP